MSDIVIDPDTGLPQLDDDMYWRIEENAVYIMGWGEWSKWFAGKPEDDYTERERRFRQFDQRLREQQETVTISGSWWRRVGESHTQIVQYPEYRLRQEKLIHSKYYGVWDEYASGLASLCVEPDPVTQDNLLQRTKEVYLDYMNKQGRERLYGDYPPKKFGVI